MGRHKTHINFPRYVTRGKSCYEYKPYRGRNVKRPYIKLCPLDAPMSEVWRQWERYQERPVDTLGWLLDQYQASREFHWRSNNKPKSAEHTKEQQRYATNLKAYLLKGGRNFGDVGLKSITPGVIRKYLDQRLKDGARVAGNREKALISTAWNWALERDKINTPNPCPKVKRNAEESRKHYAADDDYVTFLEFVKEGSYSYIWIV